MRRRGPHTAFGLYAHITWHTWRRERSIRRSDIRVVVESLLNAARRCQVHVIAQAVLVDHVHVVVSFRPDTVLASFVRDAKSESSRRVNGCGSAELRWCRGYYAGSLSRSHVAGACTYLAQQHTRHPDRIPA